MYNFIFCCAYLWQCVENIRTRIYLSQKTFVSESARGNRSGIAKIFHLGLMASAEKEIDRFPRAGWQHKFLVTGPNPDFNMVTVHLEHRKMPNRVFQ